MSDPTKFTNPTAKAESLDALVEGMRLNVGQSSLTDGCNNFQEAAK